MQVNCESPCSKHYFILIKLIIDHFSTLITIYFGFCFKNISIKWRKLIFKLFIVLEPRKSRKLKVETRRNSKVKRGCEETRTTKDKRRNHKPSPPFQEEKGHKGVKCPTPPDLGFPSLSSVTISSTTAPMMSLLRCIRPPRQSSPALPEIPNATYVEFMDFCSEFHDVDKI